MIIPASRLFGTLVLTTVVLATAPAGASCPGTGPAPVNFEAPVAGNGVAVTPDGSRILAVNPFASTLAVLDVATRSAVAEVPVGLGPVSVAIHPSGAFAYVANYVSSSVSVVDLARLAVIATIQEVAPDEDTPGAPRPDAGRSLFVRPAQVLFAADGARAFVSLSGMNRVAVLDPARHAVVDHVDLDGSRLLPGGTPAVLDRPAAMALLGSDYLAVAARASGNRTEVRYEDGFPWCASPMNRAIIDHDQCYPGSDACTGQNPYQPRCGSWCERAPEVRVVANPGQADRDLVVVHLATLEPVAMLADAASVIHGLASEPGPVSGTHRILLAHNDARNTRNGLVELQGRPWLNRLSGVVFDPEPRFEPREAIDLDAPETGAPGPDEAAALPTAVLVGASRTRYLTAAGSNRLLIVDPAGVVLGRIGVGAQPVALALAPSGRELYVLNRLDASVSFVDLTTSTVTDTVPAGANPLPVEVVAGARVVHDASLSGNGSFACISCHPEAETDELAWNLGATGARMEAGPRVSQSLRGVSRTEGFHWDGKFTNLRQLVVDTVRQMGGQIDQADADAAATYLQSIVHLPSPARRSDDSLSDPARSGLSIFFWHKEEARTSIDETCAACHQPPHWTSRRRVGGVEAASVRGLPDRRSFHHNGLVSSKPVLDCYDQPPNDVRRDNSTWKAGVRSVLITGFATLTDPEREQLIAWFEQMSTGLAGILGRQATLNQANRSDPVAAGVEAQIWAEVDRGKVLLRADGIRRDAPSAPWQQLHLAWDPVASTFCAGGGQTIERAALEAAVGAGDALLTYTADVAAASTAPMPGLRELCQGMDCSGSVVAEVAPLGAGTLTLRGQDFAPGTRLFVDGKLPPDSPLPAAPRVVRTDLLELDAGDLTAECGRVLALQVLTPDGRMSNELPVRVTDRLPNDVGPAVGACAGAGVTIGTPGLAPVSYLWSPATGLADPTRPVQTLIATETRTYVRGASVPGTSCAASDPVPVTVFAAGGQAEIGNHYRLVRRGTEVAHSWADVSGTSLNTIFITASDDRSGASTLTTVPVGAQSFVETDSPTARGIRYSFVRPDLCR